MKNEATKSQIRNVRITLPEGYDTSAKASGLRVTYNGGTRIAAEGPVEVWKEYADHLEGLQGSAGGGRLRSLRSAVTRIRNNIEVGARPRGGSLE